MISFNVRIRDFPFDENSQNPIETWKNGSREYGSTGLWSTYRGDSLCGTAQKNNAAERPSGSIPTVFSGQLSR